MHQLPGGARFRFDLVAFLPFRFPSLGRLYLASLPLFFVLQPPKPSPIIKPACLRLNTIILPPKVRVVP